MTLRHKDRHRVVLIRRAKPLDIRVIQELFYQTFADNIYHDPDYIPGWSRSKKGHMYFKGMLENPRCVCFIATHEGRPVAFADACPKSISYRYRRCLEIDNIGVLKEYRNQGIATELVMRLSEWAKKKKYEKIYLNSYTRNIAALRLYRKLGFQEIDISLEKNIST